MRKSFVIICLLLSVISLAQEKLSLYGRTKFSGNELVVRLLAPDETQFRKIMKNGFTVTRSELTNSVSVNPLTIRKNIKHYGPSDTLLWKNLLKQDTNKVGLVYNALFQKPNKSETNAETAKYSKMIFDLLMLSCDFDKEIAKACGLYFSDSSAGRNKNYEYRFSTTNEKGLEVTLLKLQVNTFLNTVNPPIKGLNGSSKGRVARLNWNAQTFSGTYGGFNVERSEDSVQFSRINKAPLILMKSEFEKKKEKIFFNDTMPVTNKTYYYRIRGIDFFGDESSPSNVLVLGSFDELTETPFLDSLITISNRHVRLHWKLTDSLQNSRVKEYLLERSAEVNKGFIKIYKGKQTCFTDSTPGRSFYYRVAAVTFYNDTIVSHTRLATIADTIPPLVPAGLKGQSEKNGLVTLRWNRVKEPNLKGYKLFKANSLHEEFVQVNNKFITDTFYHDRIELNTISGKAYYSISAVDGSYNSSANSAPVSVKRPDTIPPAKPVLFRIESKSNKAHLVIVPSLSEDVERHLVYRKIKENFELAGGFSSRDSIYYFTDSLSFVERSVQYKIAAIDESWNTSESETVSFFFESQNQKKIEKIEFSVDRKNKHIKLLWNYNEKNIDRFVIYRSNTLTPFTIVKTLAGNNLSYTDRELNIGNEYQYRIKAVFADDSESIISDPVKIVY